MENSSNQTRAQTQIITIAIAARSNAIWTSHTLFLVEQAWKKVKRSNCNKAENNLWCKSLNFLVDLDKDGGGCGSMWKRESSKLSDCVV